MYKILWSRKGEKDYEIAVKAGYMKKMAKILAVVRLDPYDPSQGFEHLVGNLNGICSRKINSKNRFFYSVVPNIENELDKYGKPFEGIVVVHESWGHNYKKPIQ